MADTKYTGHDLIVYVNEVEHLANINISKTRDVINVPGGNKIGKMKEDGQLDITGSLTLTYRKGAFSAKVTGGSVMTGIAGTTLVNAQSLNTAGILTQAGTDAKDAILSLTTAGGTTTIETDIIIDGTDLAGNKVPEIVTIPAGTPAGSVFHTTRAYDTAAKFVNTVAAGTGVTITIATTAGASSVTPGPATEFDLRVEAIKSSSGKYVKLYMPNCFATKESFEMTDANSYIGQPIEFSMKNVNEFYEEYLD